MCLSCGCNVAWDGHGDYGNITLQNVLDAAKAAGVDPDDVVNNIENTYAGFVDHDFVDVDEPAEPPMGRQGGSYESDNVDY